MSIPIYIFLSLLFAAIFIAIAIIICRGKYRSASTPIVENLDYKFGYKLLKLLGVRNKPNQIISVLVGTFFGYGATAGIILLGNRYGILIGSGALVGFIIFIFLVNRYEPNA